MKLPEPSTASPTGLLKLAVAAVPSAKAPLPPLPARVVTARVERLIERIRLLLQPSLTSATTDAGMTATPIGQWNNALVPVPSA